MPFASLKEVLAYIAPGTDMREAVNRIVERGSGGLIVLGPVDKLNKVIMSGFRMEAEFTAQRLAELSKMDGAVGFNPEQETIIYSNAHLSPDPSIPTQETGTRHKAAEQTAKQLNIPVIAISEKRKRITVYYKQQRYILRDITTMFSKVNQSLLILDKYRTDYDDAIRELTALELDDRVLPFHVANVLRRTAQMLQLEQEIERLFVELGEEQDLPSRQLHNLMIGIKKDFVNLIRDFRQEDTPNPQEIQEQILSFSSEELLSTEKVMAPLGYDDDELDQFLTSRGYRLLSKIPRLPSAVIERLVDEFDSLTNIAQTDQEKLQEVKGIAEARANNIKAGLRRLEQRVTIMEELES